MPYYLVPLVALPYPHAMSGGADTGCPFALAAVRERAARYEWTPDPETYQHLYRDPDLQQRAQQCPKHRGDWSTVLPVLAELLGAVPADTPAAVIAATAADHPALAALNEPDRDLAASLLHPRDPIRLYRTASGVLLANGQHRICAARTAGITHVPVWFDERSPAVPAAAQRLQLRRSERGVVDTPG
jgi:hypothetical protein